MEKFILIFRGSDVYEAGPSPEALQALTVKMIGWLDELSTTGQHVASEALQRTGRQINSRSEEVLDSCFGVSKEVVGGWTIVLAKDFDDAVALARRCPILESNANIEIRPLQSITQKNI